MKLTEEEFGQVMARENALRSANILFSMAQAESKLFLGSLLEKYGLDKNKNYNISKDGEILEIKSEPIEEKS